MGKIKFVDMLNFFTKFTSNLIFCFIASCVTLFVISLFNAYIFDDLEMFLNDNLLSEIRGVLIGSSVMSLMLFSANKVFDRFLKDD